MALLDVVDGKKEVTDGAEAGFIGLCAIVNDGDGFGVCLFACPFFKDGGKLMIGDDDVFVNIWNTINVVEHTTENGTLSNFQ